MSGAIFVTSLVVVRPAAARAETLSGAGIRGAKTVMHAMGSGR